jgi:hypothetical protein
LLIWEEAGMQVSKNGRVRRSPDEWRSVVDRFEASGLSSRTFCRQEQVNLSSLIRWRRKLGRRVDDSGFVEVSTPASPGSSWAVEIELPDGCVVRVRG